MLTTIPLRHALLPVATTCCLALIAVRPHSAHAAPQLAVLHSFAGPPADGANPLAGSLTADSAGNLYGTTYNGGTSNLGTVFKVTPGGTETVLYSFLGQPDGRSPYSNTLLADAAGNLYGTTSGGGNNGAGCDSQSGGYGTVFKLTPSGAETVLYSFAGPPDALCPVAGLIADSAGNLYGTTSIGGPSDYGTVFKLTPSGAETVLYLFTGGTDGANPYGGLLADSTGNLYGTTAGGPPQDRNGTVFKITASGTETMLYSFGGSPDGTNSFAGLIADGAGNLYGTTYGGGAYGCGLVFKVTPAGAEAVLYSFLGVADGANPNGGVIIDGAGNLYGTTTAGGASGAGTVFQVTPSGIETVLYSFTGAADGGSPHAGLLADTAGNLYGTTQAGGAPGFGTVYRLSSAGFVPLVPPPTAVAGTGSGGTNETINVGQTVQLNGSASFAPDTTSASLGYAWSFVSIPSQSVASLTGASTSTPSFVADAPGTYLVQLVVTDPVSGLSSPPSQVTISSIWSPPTARAGSAQSTIVGTTVTLAGTGSDPNGLSLSFAWSLVSAPTGSTATLSGATTANPSITPDTEGLYAVGLVVSDQFGSSAQSTVTISVITAVDYAQQQISAAVTYVATLPVSQFQAPGHRHSLTNLMQQAIAAVQAGDLPMATQLLNQTIVRTDGCPLRGAPDGPGQEMDWVVNCPAQNVLYQELTSALNVLP